MKAVIKELRLRRIRDFWNVQSTLNDEELKMPDDFDTDPADKDLELKKKLDESKATGELNLNKASWKKWSGQDLSTALT